MHSVPADLVRDGFDDRRAAQHSGLRRIDTDVQDDGVDLLTHELRGELHDRSDARGVLGGERRDRGHPEHAEGGKRLEIGLDAGPAAGVRPGDRERAWNSHLGHLLVEK